MPGDDFASMMEGADPGRGVRRLSNGEVVDGIVVQIGADSVFVDVGARLEGRIDRGELEDAAGKVRVRVGDRVRATVSDVDAPDGPLLVTTVGRQDVNADALKTAMEAGLPVEGTIAAEIKGGAEVDVGGVRAFCPASQLGLAAGEDIGTVVGQTHRFHVLEVRDGGRSVVVSRKAALEQERARRGRELLESLREGMDVDGVVTAVQKYGAFVDLGGVEGLVHVSELSARRVDRVEDVVRAGDPVRVRVLGIEPTDKGVRVRLSLRALETGADERAAPTVARDEVLEARVSKLAPFGVFVETSKGEGLVPVKELGLAPGADHRRAYAVGAELRVVLARRDERSGKLTFSARRVAEVEERQNYAQFSERSGTAAKARQLGSLGDLLREKLGLPESDADEHAAPDDEPPRVEEPTFAEKVAAGQKLAPARDAAGEPTPSKDPVPPREAGARRPPEEKPRARKPTPPGVVRRRKKS